MHDDYPWRGSVLEEVGAESAIFDDAHEERLGGELVDEILQAGECAAREV